MNEVEPIAFLRDVCGARGMHSLCWQARGDKRMNPTTHSTVERLADEARKLNGVNVYFGAGLLKGRMPAGKRGGEEDVEGVRALWVDLDWAGPAHTSESLPGEAEVRDWLALFPSPPTYVVETGHGLQAWWVLDGFVPHHDAKRMLALLHEALRALGLTTEGADLARVMRMPGTMNVKLADDPKPVVAYRTGPVYSAREVDELLVHLACERYEPTVIVPASLVPVERQPIPLPSSAQQPIGADDELASAADWFDANADALGYSIGSMLDRAAWIRGRDHGAGDDGGVEYTRPGAQSPGARDHGNWLSIWHRNADPAFYRVGKPGKAGAHSLSRFDVYAASFHDGNASEAARAIRTTMMPKPPPSRQTPPQRGESGEQVERAPIEWPRLPEAFWQSRPELAHIAAAADAHMVSREAVLVCVVVLTWLHVPNAIGLPAKPRPAPLNGYACVVGRPGEGKGSAIDLALRLLPPPSTTRHTKLGTAEGLIKTFYERDPEHTGKGAAKLVRHYYPVVVRTDEVGAFAVTAGSKGERGPSLLAELKQAFSGEWLGKGYADDDKGLQVAPATYRLAGLLGIAPDKAEPLFGDLGGGFPERLVFAPAAPVHLPDHRHQVPADPGSLGWSSPFIGYRNTPGAEFVIADPVLDDVHRMVVTARRPGADPLDAHAGQITLKLAVGFAMLARRVHVTVGDWRAAGDLWALSTATRALLLRAIAIVKADAEHFAGQMSGVREVQKVKAVHEYERFEHERYVIGVAESITAKVRGGVVNTRREALRSLGKKQAEVGQEAIDYALDAGLLVETVEPTQTGSDRRRLSLGPVPLK